MERGKTFIVSGPSGAGKSTVLKALFALRGNLYFSVSATTRAPRPGEEDGVHYHFIDHETFRDWVDRGEFLEYAEFVGNAYGTPKRYVDEAMDRGEDVILDIETKGADQVKAKRPDTVRIFLIPPSWEELERRLKGRGTDDEETIRRRLAQARTDISSANAYDYYVITDSVDRAARELDAILTAEHCRSAERLKTLEA